MGTAADQPGTGPERDRLLDLLRLVAMGTVVAFHWLVPVVVRTGDGVEITLGLDGQRHAWVTWLLQLMPVFFLVGGAVAFHSLRQPRRVGYGSWLVRRVERLSWPVLPLVPDCQWVEPGDSWQVPTGPTHQEYVIKPVVSAGSRNTSRHQAGHDDQRAEETVARLLAQGHTLVVQPYLSAVDSAGETALVYLGGRYSHALRKGPLLAPGGQLAENITARQPAPAELRVGDQVLATVVERFAAVPAYLRVDLLPGPDGVPVVLECELVEPGLWLDQREGAADELAEWVLAALGRALP